MIDIQIRVDSDLYDLMAKISSTTWTNVCNAKGYNQFFPIGNLVSVTQDDKSSYTLQVCKHNVDENTLLVSQQVKDEFYKNINVLHV